MTKSPEFDKLSYVVYARVSTARAIDTKRTQNIYQRAENERFRSSGRKCASQNDARIIEESSERYSSKGVLSWRNDSSRSSENFSGTIQSPLNIHTMISGGAVFLPRPGIRSSLQALADVPLLASHRLAFKSLCVLLGCRSQSKVSAQAIESWRGYVPALVNYVYNAADELSLRGLTNVTGDLLDALLSDAPAVERQRVSIPHDVRYVSTVELHDRGLLPWWFGWSVVHSSHRTALRTESVAKLVHPAGKGRGGKVTSLHTSSDETRND